MTTDPVHERLRAFWDVDAETYDLAPNHAMTDPVEAAAWRATLRRLLPPPPARVLDVGAGTGAMSLLAAELGYNVTALDLSTGMLARAAAKAERAGLQLKTVVAPATKPPSGRFDVVMERHVLWTMPRPVEALAAWRRSADRVLVLEGIWHPQTLPHRARAFATDLVEWALGTGHDHHAEYEPDLLASLPLARRISPAAVLEALAQAGWRRARLERLRDVEWARLLATPSILRWMGAVPRFAIVAET